MKKSLIALALSSFFIIASNAQTVTTTNAKGSPYIRVGLGYAFPQAGNVIVDETIYAGSQSYEVQKYSYGAGLNAAVGFGYWFTKNLGLELAANIGIAPKKYESTLTVGTGGTSGTVATNYKQYAKTPVYLMPSVLLKAGSDEISVYSRMGLAVNVAGKVVTETNEDYVSDVVYSETELKFRTGVGFQGALGVAFAAGDKISIFAELNGISMSQYAKSGELTEATVNGVDVLSTLDPNDTQVEFENSVTEPTTVNPNVPAKSPTFSVPFSNIGVSAGIMIGF